MLNVVFTVMVLARPGESWSQFTIPLLPSVFLLAMAQQGFFSKPSRIKFASVAAVVLLGAVSILGQLLDLVTVSGIFYLNLSLALIFTAIGLGEIIMSAINVSSGVQAELRLQREMSAVSGKLYLAQASNEFLHEIKNQLSLLLNHKNLLVLKLKKLKVNEVTEISNQIDKLDLTEKNILRVVAEFTNVYKSISSDIVAIQMGGFLQSVLDGELVFAKAMSVEARFIDRSSSSLERSFYIHKEQVNMVVTHLLHFSIESAHSSQEPHSRRVEIELNDDQDHIFILIRSFGPSLTHEQKEKLFAPGYRHRQGAIRGIDFAVSQKMIVGMRGFLMLSDRKDCTEFIVALPKRM